MSEFYSVFNKINYNGLIQPTPTGIAQCFEEFELKKTLKQEEAWYCPTCKDHKKAQIKKKIYKSPKIMIINLDRFSWNGNKLLKNTTIVTFPLEIDMKMHALLNNTHRTIPEIKEVLIAPEENEVHKAPQ